MAGNALAYFHEQFHQPEDRSAIRVGLILRYLRQRSWPDELIA
jgi:hypothetical protein